jgi:hypothetical protein
MNDIKKMKDELEKLKVLKQAKEELGQEFFSYYCENLGIDAPDKPLKTAEIVPSSKEIKEKNYKAFIADLDNSLSHLFKNNPGSWHVNTQRNNRLEYQIDIEPKDELDKLASAAVSNIGKKKIRIDSKDGEYVFTYIFNPIFKHLGFDKRFEVDDKPYKGMGDNGDFKYGMKRLDIKLRQREKVIHRWDLWVNEKDADAGYNEFILMRRDGDYNKEGEQRRITVAGYATVDQVKSTNPEVRNRRDSRVLKYEVEEKNMMDMRELIKLVLKEVLDIEE